MRDLFPEAGWHKIHPRFYALGDVRKKKKKIVGVVLWNGGTPRTDVGEDGFAFHLDNLFVLMEEDEDVPGVGGAGRGRRAWREA